MKRTTLPIVAVTVVAVLSRAPAATFFAGPDGARGNPGTKEQPFATIQEAVDRCGPGDECVVLAGRYRETVRLSKSGLPGKPIVVRAAGEVFVDGTDSLAGPWKAHAGNIVRTGLPEPAVEQAFTGGVPLSPARWPNARFRDTWIRSKWARSAEGSKKDLMICDALARTGVDWTGAIAVLNVGHQYKTWTREILTHGRGKRSFTYALDERLGDGKDDGKSWWNDRFYITGTLKALDAPGEFFHDADSGVFYLATDDGATPNPGSIRVKRRNYGIVGSRIADVHIGGLHFFGCTLQLRDATRTIVENCDFRFPAYTMMVGETMPRGKGWFQTPATSVTGRENVFKGLYVAYAGGPGIQAAGCSNRVDDCIVHDACWNGTINHAGISIRPYRCKAALSTVSRCTVYNVGNIGILYRGGSNVVEHCHVHHTGLACHDIAAIHTGSPATAGSIARYNWVHHSMGLAMRGDDQTRELTVHHNLVWDCDQGIIVKGDRNKVYHNTILGRDGHGRLTITTRQEPKKWWTPHPILPVQNQNSLFFNNYFEGIVYRHKPIPRNRGISHNLAYDGKTPYVDALVKVSAPALKSGLPDARPRENSVVVDKGRVVEGLTDGYTGKAPDVGAYEYGKPAWRAGALRPAPPAIALPVEAEVARSWKLEKSGGASIPLPVRFADLKLSNLSKQELRKLYDSCWTPDELERRRVAIQKRGKPDSPEYARHHPVVRELHKQAFERLKERALSVLSGDELELFRSIVGGTPAASKE